MPAYKKDKTWYCSFYYEDWTGKRKKKKKEGFSTKKAALQFEREFLEKSQASPDMSFGALIDIYVEDCKTRLKPTTYATKQTVIKNHLLPYFKDMPINTIEPTTIRKWQNEMMTGDYAPTYLRSLSKQLSAVLNFAVKYYKLPTNPCRVCGSMGTSNSGRVDFWTLDEFSQAINMSDNPVCTVIYQVLFWTGIRIGECLALTLNDFNIKNKTVIINKNYTRQNKKDLIQTPKTPRSNRVITIPQFLCDIIAEYVKKLYGYTPEQRLFVVTKPTIKKYLDQVAKKAGVKRIRVHDLRHSHASLLIEQGFSPLLIAERLGHENVKTTLQTYSHLYPNKHSEVADKLNDISSTLLVR